MQYVIDTIKHIPIFVYVLLILYYIMMNVVLWMLFTKDKKNPWYALIPFYNYYILFTTCRLPFISIFIPLANIVVLFLLPYRITKQYKGSKLLQVLSVLVPPILLYIAFGKEFTNKDNRYKPEFLKTIDDVNQLENKLVKDTDYIIDDSVDIQINKEPVSHINTFADKIEQQIINDNIVYDDEIVIEPKEEKKVEEIIDLNVEELNSLDDLDRLEKDMELRASINETNHEDVNADEAKTYISDSAIAFGGKQKEEESTFAKKDEQKCPRCGSSLVGAMNNICPGCGAPINSDN